MKFVAVAAALALCATACSTAAPPRTTTAAPVRVDPEPTTTVPAPEVTEAVTVTEPAPPPPPAPTTSSAPPAVKRVVVTASSPKQTVARVAPQPTPPVPVRQAPPRPNRAEGGDGGNVPEAAPPPPSSTALTAGDFPDPFIIRAGTTWVGYSTQHGMTQVPVIESDDLVHWQARGDALARLPDWAAFGYVWAPAVSRVGAGYVLYYATRVAATGQQCISRAVSVLATGPFVDSSDGPMICQTDHGGSIDPSPVTNADGAPWLVWKSEGTLDGDPTRLWSAPLTADGLSLAAAPTTLLATSSPWEGPIIEAPSMVVDATGVHLFYSGNRWETGNYAVGHAVCASVAGPCRRTADTPILRSDATTAGPGGGEVFRDLDGSYLLAFHAWEPSSIGYPAGARRLHIDRLRLDASGAVATPRQTGLAAGPG